jgi:hypothetical protein
MTNLLPVFYAQSGGLIAKNICRSSTNADFAMATAGSFANIGPWRPTKSSQVLAGATSLRKLCPTLAATLIGLACLCEIMIIVGMARS